MLRGHFKSIAIHSLITALLASPIIAATPGDASRRIAKQATPSHRSNSAVQNAHATATNEAHQPIRQVVGKQPSAPQRDPNRRLTLLPNLFGTGTSPSTQAGPSANQTQRPSTAPRQPVQNQGILSDLFGGNTAQPARVPSATQSTRNTVDWEGIPYHQARSRTNTNTRVPIRDPQPGETRIATRSQVQDRSAAPQLPAPSSRRNPSVPQPPALAPAPSSRRSIPATVASSRMSPVNTSVLSPLSSSRRSGRREVPTLEASEIAAAKAAPTSEVDLVPKVARRTLKTKPETTTTDVAQSKAAKPTSEEAKSTETKPTPSADVAVKTQPAATPAKSAASAEATKPESAVASVPSTETQPTADQSGQRTVAAAPTVPATPKAAMTSEQPPAEHATPQPQNQVAQSATAPAPANSAPSQLSQETPQFVAPNLPAPSAPQFGVEGSVAGHRTGPPATAFQPRHFASPSAPAITPSPSSNQGPIGSGVAAPQPRLAQTPTQPRHDPYARPTVPNTTNEGSSLGTPLPLRNTARTGAAMASNPVQDSNPQVASNHSRPSSAVSAFSNTPFESSTASQSISSRSPANQLLPGQTAVASELPGIRVITHGPSSVIIRQTHEFEIRVENRGSIDATGVLVRAEIPDWADIKGQSTSRGEIESQSTDENDRLVWTIDSLPAGTTEKLFVRLQALQSGTHELDVDWTLVPQKSVAKIEVREPKLDLVIEGPEEVVYGESQTYKVRVLNPGDGIAPNVVFTLSPNSSTPQTQRIGNIPSGKEAQFEVELTAQDLGDLMIHGLASGDLGLKAQAEKTIRVSAAELEAVLAGPELKYQNTDAMYLLQLTNTGTATSKNISASIALPPGIRYEGGIDLAKKRGTKLTWEIDALTPGATREYEFHCTMLSPGKQTFEFAANGTAAGQTSVALDTEVESIADLVMTIEDPVAPAPVGSEVTYEILIRNRGSRQAKGVRAIAQFSSGIEPRRIEGHSGQVLTGQVLFDPIDTIRPGEEVRIRVIAEADNEGHHRFRTEIRSGETVLVAEEATQYLSKRGQRVSRRSSSSSSAR